MFWSPGADWQHRECGDKKSPDLGLDKASGGVQNAIPRGDDKVEGGRGNIRRNNVVGGKQVGGISRRKQRWDKLKYNLYMRKYMKVYRAKRRLQGL